MRTNAVSIHADPRVDRRRRTRVAVWQSLRVSIHADPRVDRRPCTPVELEAVTGFQSTPTREWIGDVTECHEGEPADKFQSTPTREWIGDCSPPSCRNRSKKTGRFANTFTYRYDC